MQASLLASCLQKLIIDHVDKHQLLHQFGWLTLIAIARAVCSWGRERASYRAGEAVRGYIRQRILDKLHQLGPAYIKGKPAGSWATLLIEQVEDMQDFFAHYLPQMSLASLTPNAILVVVFPINWAAGLIFLLTAPLIPIFMAFVGKRAAEANRKKL